MYVVVFFRTQTDADYIFAVLVWVRVLGAVWGDSTKRNILRRLYIRTISNKLPLYGFPSSVHFDFIMRLV